MMVHIFDVPFLRRWWRQPLRIPTTDLGGGGPTRYLDHILDFVGISFMWGHFIAFIIYCADLPFLSIARRFCDGRPSLYIGPSFYDDSLALPSSNDSNTCDGCSPLHNSRKFRDGCPSLRIARRFRDRHNTFLHITRRSHEGPTSLQIVRSFSGVYDLFHKSVRGHEFIVQTLCMQACVPNVFRVPQVFRFPDVKKINYTENCATADFPLLGSTSWKFRSIPSQNYGSWGSNLLA